MDSTDVSIRSSEAVMEGTELSSTEFIRVIQEQVGDVRDFMKLKGINLNNHKEFNNLINNGIAIREHFRQQLHGAQKSKVIHKKAVQSMAGQIQNLMRQATIKIKAARKDEIDEEESEVEIDESKREIK